MSDLNGLVKIAVCLAAAHGDGVFFVLGREIAGSFRSAVNAGVFAAYVVCVIRRARAAHKAVVAVFAVDQRYRIFEQDVQGMLFASFLCNYRLFSDRRFCGFCFHSNSLYFRQKIPFRHLRERT